MLVRDIFPPRKIKKIIKEEVCGIKPYKTKKRKYFNIGSRIFIAVGIIFIIVFSFAGFSFGAICEEKLRVELYSSKCVGDTGNSEEIIEPGWQNIENAGGEPDVLPKGSIESFFKGNSAVYKGGLGNLLCEGFYEADAKKEDAKDAEEKIFQSAKIYFSFALDELETDFQQEEGGELSRTVLDSDGKNENEHEENVSDDLFNDSEDLTDSSAAEISDDLLVNPNIDTKIIIWRSLDGGETWHSLDKISTLPLSNFLNSGYFSYNAPFLKNWEDVENLKIKFEGVVGGETDIVAYLDSVWVEAEYKKLHEEEFKIDKIQEDFSPQDFSLLKKSVAQEYLEHNKNTSEVIEDRNLTSKIFNNNDSTFTIHEHIGHIHYKDKLDKEFKEIDTTLIPTEYGWEMRKANYETEIPKYADDWFKFINSFILDPRTNDEHNLPEEIISMKPIGIEHVEGQLITDEKENWQNKKIVYPNAYGQDIDLVIQARNTAFDKLVVINKKPSDLSKDLEFKFEIDVDNGTVFKPKKELSKKVFETEQQKLKILEAQNKKKKYTQAIAKFEDETQREIWDKTKAIETSDSIILGKLKKTWFMDFKVWDSKGNQGTCKVRLEEENGKLFLTKIIDKEFLEKAVYPVFTDDSATYYSGTADGYVGNWGSSWTTVRGAATGSSCNNSSLNYGAANYALWHGEGEEAAIIRSFFYFDTSALPDDCTIDAAVLKIYGYGSAQSSVSAQKGTQADTLTTADYDSFTGSEYGHTNWVINQYNLITFNAQGKTDINKTGTTKICTREYAHDYLNSEPSDDEFSNGCYYAEEAGTSKDPYLEVTYTVSSGITISGASDSTGTVAVAVNDVLQTGKTGTISAGAWSISSVSVNSGDIVTVWIDGATDANESTGIAKYDGTGDMTGMVLNKHTLSIGSVDDQSLTVANLGQYDNDQDPNIMHSANSSTLNVDDDNAYTDEKIDILSGDTLTIGGTETLTTHDAAINGSLTSSGAGTFNVSGSWDNNNDYNSSLETINFTSTTTETIDSTGATDSDFYDLTFNGSGGAWTLTTALIAQGDITTTEGAISGTQNLIVNGGAITGTNGSISLTGGTTTLSDTGNLGPTGTGTYTFSNLTLSGITTATGNFTVSSVLTISNTFSLDASDETITLSGSGTPFVVNGTFTASTSTVEYTNTTSANVTATTYNNLQFNPASGTPTYTLGTAGSQTITTNNDFIIVDGIVTAATNDPTINIGGNLTVDSDSDNNGSFTKGTGTLTFNGATTPITWADNNSTKSDMGNVTIDGTSKVTNLGSAVKATNLTIGADDTLDVTANNYSMNIGGNWTNSGTFTCRSGTVTFDAATTGKTITDGGDPFYNITFSGASGEWLYQDGADGINQTTVTAGTPTYLNTKTGTLSVSVSGTGTLNVDWYLGIHVVDAVDTSNINTEDTDITISENTPASTIWKWSGSDWDTPASLKTTGTDSNGIIPSPETDRAIRIREYSKTSGAATYYRTL